MLKFSLSALFILQYFILSAQQVTIPTFGTDNTLEVASWNIEHFPKKDQTTVNYVTQIIQNLDIDVFAFQEISDTVFFKQMVNELPDYHYHIKSSYYAGLAYMYKTSSVQINSIYEIYTTSPYWRTFPRSPVVMDMEFMGENIIVINNHYKCCGDGIMEMGNTNDEEYRRYRASNLLKEYIDNNFSDKKVLVVGDLNDNIADSQPNNVFENIISDSQNYLFADMQIAEGSYAYWSYPSWPSHLDHILITNELFDALLHPESEISTLRIDHHLTSGWWEYDNNVSDHRPVAIKLHLGSTTNVSSYSQTLLSAIYPNPAKEAIHVQLKEGISIRSVDLYTLSGQLIKTSVTADGVSLITLPIPDVQPGIYFLLIHSEINGSETHKIVVVE